MEIPVLIEKSLFIFRDSTCFSFCQESSVSGALLYQQFINDRNHIMGLQKDSPRPQGMVWIHALFLHYYLTIFCNPLPMLLRQTEGPVFCWSCPPTDKSTLTKLGWLFGQSLIVFIVFICYFLHGRQWAGSRDHFVYAPSHWETSLQCNVVSHWLGAYTKWSLGSLSLSTHWGRDKMVAISQTTFSNAFSWMKMFEFQLIFHWSLFPRVQLTIFQHSSENGLALNRPQAIIWTNADLIHWHICDTRGRWFD